MNRRPASIFENLSRAITVRAPHVALAVIAAWIGVASASAQTWDYSLNSSVFASLPTLPEPAGISQQTIQAVATDYLGNVYLAVVGANATSTEFAYRVFEMVAVNGQIYSYSSVIAVDLSSTANGLAGIAVDNLTGDVYVTDGHSKVIEIAAVGNEGIMSTSTVTALGSSWNEPQGIAVNTSGSVFVADTGNHAVKELVWGEYGTIVHIRILLTPPVGSGFVSPFGLAFGPDGNLYVSDQSNQTISQVKPVSGVFSSGSPVAQVGPPVNLPGALSVDRSGNILVVTGDIAEGTTIKEIAPVGGSFPASSPAIPIGTNLGESTGLAQSFYGGVLVADTTSGLVQIQSPVADFGAIAGGSASTVMLIPFEYTQAGTLTGWQVLTDGSAGLDFSEVPGSTSCGSNPLSAGWTCTVAVQFTPTSSGVRTGSVVFHVQNSGIVLRESVASVPLKGIGIGPQVSYPGNRAGTVVANGFNQPWGLAVDGSGNVFVADTGSGSVKKIVATGGAVSSASPVVTVGSGLGSPSGIALDGAGNIYIADSQNAGDSEIVGSSSLVPGFLSIFSVAKPEDSQSTGLAIDADGNVFLSNMAGSSAGSVKVAPSSNGRPFTGPGASLPVSADTNAWGVAVDGSGNVYYTDYYAGAVYEVVAVNGEALLSSEIVPIATGFNQPVGIAVDAAGNVYVADSGNQSVKEILSAVGDGSSKPAVITIGTGFLQPYGVALDAQGNVYVSDNTANTVTELPLASAPSLKFPTPTRVGKVDAADGLRSVTIANSGNAQLVFPIPVSGDDPSVSANFLWDNSSTCPQVDSGASLAVALASGSSCTIAVEFEPASSGTISGSIVLTDTAINAARPGYPITQSISLAGSATGDPQTITFHPITTVEHIKSTISLSASANSGLAVSFSSSTPKVCGVSGAKAALLAVGTCTIEATQAGNDVYAAATPVKQSFAIKVDIQTISFPAISAKEYAGKAMNLTATASSGLSVSFLSKTPKVCAVSGSRASLLIAGTCTIEAKQSGDSIYEAATAVSRSFTVLHTSQSISFAKISSKQYAGKTLDLHATASSELKVSFLSETPKVCTISNATASLLAAGTCTVEATQEGDAIYGAANRVSQSFSVLASE